MKVEFQYLLKESNQPNKKTSPWFYYAKPVPLRCGYGVHTSHKIAPKAWFHRLALGCAIAIDCLSLRGGTTKQSQKLDDYAITSLRS